MTPPVGATDSAIVLVPSGVTDVSFEMSFIFQPGVLAGTSITVPGGLTVVPEPSALVLFVTALLFLLGYAGLAKRRIMVVCRSA
jgi:hypothetical protein